MKLSSDKISIFSTQRKERYWGDVLLLILCSFSLRLAALNQTIYANGWDAYFYLIQIKSWIEEGEMHSSDNSLIYPLMRVIYWFSGDYVSSFKMTSAILATAFVILIYIWGRKITVYGITITLALYFLWSPHLTWFAAQYPKNLLGINLLLLLFISFKSQWWWLPILLLIINYFGHRMTFVLGGIYFVIYFFGRIINDNSSFRSLFQFWKKELLIFVGILLMFLFLTPFFAGTLSFIDLERFSGALTNQPHFAPLTFFNEYNESQRLSSFWKIEIVLSAVFYFVGILFLLKKISLLSLLSKEKEALFGRNGLEQIALFILCTILIFPFLKWSLTSMSFRFVLVFIFLSPIYFVLSLSAIKLKQRQNIVIPIVASILLFATSFFSWKSYNPRLHDAPYEKYDRITQETFDFLKDKNPELVIAHNALAEYFTFTTGVDALPWQPEYEIAENKLWRIMADVRLPIFRTYLSEDDFKNLKRIGVNYFVIQESVWQKLKDNLLKNKELEVLEKINTWRNPYRVRPDFLLKNKKQ